MGSKVYVLTYSTEQEGPEDLFHLGPSIGIIDVFSTFEKAKAAGIEYVDEVCAYHSPFQFPINFHTVKYGDHICRRLIDVCWQAIEGQIDEYAEPAKTEEERDEQLEMWDSCEDTDEEGWFYARGSYDREIVVRVNEWTVK